MKIGAPSRQEETAMKIDRINPPDVPRDPPYTRIVTAEGPMKLCYFSGQTPQSDDMGCMAPGDLKAQYLFIMEKIALQLRVVGADWSNVTHRRLYLTDWEAWDKVRDDLPAHFEELPSSTEIGVVRLSHPDFMIEIDVVAVVPA